MTALEEIFLNKTIEVPFPYRDERGKIVPNKFGIIRGVCTFIGENKILNWPLQVTIDRTPVEVKHINHIKII
jgi:hypothetical protein